MFSVDTFRKVLEDNLSCKEINIKYIDSIPKDIASAFSHNEYVNNIAITAENTLEILLGVDLFDEYAWFVWDWKPGYSIEIQDHKYIINNIDDFMKYLVDTNKLTG
jgi:hypothetical protein